MKKFKGFEKLDNSKSGLLDAVDKSKLIITDNSKVALFIEASLKSYDKNSKTLVYDIKPYYIIDGGEKRKIPNEAIKKSVSIKVPILKEITEKYAKVIHKNGDKVIDEKTYEIKTDGNENVTETPNTSDNILLYVFTSVISVAGVVVLACISKKGKILSLR